MMEESRSTKTIRNAKVALIYYFIGLLLNFFSRKVFLDHLGAEVLGLNTTIANLLGFLNLAELGIGVAIVSSLYTPFFHKDKKTIAEIISVQGWLYRRVALIVLAGALVLMGFFPLIFEKADLPMWYTYITLLVFLVSSLLGYFVNYRQVVLTADQKDYKRTIHIKTLSFVKVIAQMLAVVCLEQGYVYWLLLEFVFALLNAYVLDRLVKREYPWLKTSVREGKMLRKKYPEIVRKTKQLFFHSMGGFVLSQISPLIIYAFASLTLVAIYGNYMLIVMGLMGLVGAIFSSMTAGVGSLMAEGNKEKTLSFFWEFASFRFWIASVICVGFFMFSHTFIELWIGKAYLLGDDTLVLLTILLFLQLTRVADLFLSASGLFKDIWSPIIEAVINISVSVVLGSIYGLNGIIAGVVISLFLVIFLGKPVFLFVYGLKENVWMYFKKVLKYLFFIALSFVFPLFCYLSDRSNIWVLIGVFLLYSFATLGMFSLFDKSFRIFVKKILQRFNH